MDYLITNVATGQSVEVTLWQAAVIMAIDADEIEFTIEEFGKTETDGFRLEPTTRNGRS